MANVLTKGSVLTHNEIMQELYAWTQCIGIDASIPGAIMRTLHFYRQREWVKAGLYTILSVLLLFTAAIVSNIEAVQQTLNLSLDNAYGHVFVSIETLIWIRSIAIVLLIVAHAARHVQAETIQSAPVSDQQPTAPPVTVQLQEEHPKQIAAPQGRTSDVLARVQAYLADHPHAKAKEVAKALSISLPTARKWLGKARSI
jgi:hypothetical protein